MSILKPVRILGAVAIMASVPLIAASAQSLPPAPSGPPLPTQKPLITPRADKSVTPPAKVHPLIGQSVFSAHGYNLGSVHSVATDADGKVAAIHIKTGSFLGIGGKLVAIPEGKFTRSGVNVRLGMTAEEVSKLPEVKGHN